MLVAVLFFAIENGQLILQSSLICYCHRQTQYFYSFFGRLRESISNKNCWTRDSKQLKTTMVAKTAYRTWF